ncbi:methyltransferase domain-containing protein [Pedobacter sp. ISL-68]|uniref:class I SAM-dependent methyltransferase n=1 Tax=unclassified Pedobacter TaxID=2628915 RepID=UPI001BECF445|nr:MULTISPECIES: class I SAM-dependent methyltransferase [unclassified Pedobacter]MBT2560073.1 methyltransferase domain-containing protein [Pedobacter sp. ISL-64]MBT2589052.1 methyltransferase domain-containing protein [Pedobacter sp. ISL-68]
MNSNLQFSGLIPQHYQELLAPFLFDGFSRDLVDRINFVGVRDVLELASGTGSLTYNLLQKLPAEAHLLATDLERSMLEVASQRLESEHLSWDVVDMTSIPYVDEQFDLIVCQFGLMLVPDKLKALTEMRRVLKKGGRLVFSVWADIQDNAVWEISGKVIESFLGANPMLQNPGPFSLANKDDATDLLEKAGFENSTVTSVAHNGTIESAAMSAGGMIQGLPVFMAINKRDPALVSQIVKALESKLESTLGNHPLISPLRALVFENVK